MKPHLKSAGLKVGKDILLNAAALTQHYEDTLPADEEMAECDCGGVSSCSLDACPFCGSAEPPADEEEEAAAPEPKPEPKKPPATPKKPPTKGKKPKAAPVVDDEPEAVEPPPEPKKPPVKSKGKKPAHSGSKASIEAAGKKPAAKKPAAKKPAAKKPAAKKGKAAKDPVTTVVGKDDTAASLATKLPSHLSVADLDGHCKTIKKSVRKVGEEYYKTALAFKAIQDQELWKLRENSRGERAYTNFGQWAKTELAINASGAYQMIRLVEQFTEDDIKKIGPSKLRIALTLPKDKAAKLLKEGGSMKEMSERAKQLREGKSAGKDAVAPANPVTVAVIEQSVELPMQVRSTDEQAPVGEDTEPATSLDQDPWAMMELENDTKMFFRIFVDEDGDIILNVETRRGGDAG